MFGHDNVAANNGPKNDFFIACWYGHVIDHNNPYFSRLREAEVAKVDWDEVYIRAVHGHLPPGDRFKSDFTHDKDFIIEPLGTPEERYYAFAIVSSMLYVQAAHARQVDWCFGDGMRGFEMERKVWVRKLYQAAHTLDFHLRADDAHWHVGVKFFEGNGRHRQEHQ